MGLFKNGFISCPRLVRFWIVTVTAKQAARFWSWVDIKGPYDCWFWTGHKAGEYGQYKIGSVRDGSRKNEYAHRVACELSHGRIPERMQALHKCDRKLCCNPAHLEIGTCSKNHKDAWDRGLRTGRKLNQKDVDDIRAMPCSNRDVAKLFDIDSRYAWEIRKYKVWNKKRSLTKLAGFGS